MKLTTFLPILMIGSAAQAVSTVYTNNVASCRNKNTGGGPTMVTAQWFCKPDNIDTNSAYARNGITLLGGNGVKAKAYINSKNCPPGIPLLSKADCMRQFMYACANGDKQGFGTVRVSAGGCLTFGIAHG